MAYQNVISQSDAEASFLTTVAAKGKEIFTIEDAYLVLGKSKGTRDALDRLVEKGWLERIEKGKYLIVPLQAGPDRMWTEDAFVVAQYLVEPSAVAYWSALSYWNLTDQLPRVAYVQTTARKKNRRPTVLGMRFRIVRVKPQKFFGNQEQPAGQSSIRVTDREKTIIDCLDRPELSGGVAEVAKAIREGDGKLDWNRITEYLRRFGSGAVGKRLGFLVETQPLNEPPSETLLGVWTGLLTAGISPLDPSSPREPHRIVTRWRIAVNLPEPITSA